MNLLIVFIISINGSHYEKLCNFAGKKQCHFLFHMARRYVIFIPVAYGYSIARPLAEEIIRRGDEVAWFVDPGCPDMLRPGDLRLASPAEACTYNPLAVLVPGDWVYPDIPGIKVELFHGYPIRKRTKHPRAHFDLRGWFDIYCTQGPSSTTEFQRLADKKGYFRVYETGWPKVDSFVKAMSEAPSRAGCRPRILYATTFTKGITSAYDMVGVIDRLAAEKPWDWLLTLHPKLNDPELIIRYEDLAHRHDNVEFVRQIDTAEALPVTDALLCDSSSIIVEYMIADKPVVTLRNTNPGPWLIDIDDPELAEEALERALSRPPKLMAEIRRHALTHEAHRDGLNSSRVLDAIDDFIATGGARRRKPLNLVRRFKMWRRERKLFR